MGVSSDAVLLYGINLGEDLVEIVRDLEIFEEGTDYDLLDPDEAWEALDESLPRCLELVLTGHPEGCPNWFIAAKGYLTANRGFSKSLKKLPRGSKSAQKALKKLSTQLDIQVRSWLASYADF